MNYSTITIGELHTDIFQKNGHGNVFELKTKDDMNIEKVSEIVIDGKDYPPGTLISIKIPQCPKCYMTTDECRENHSCDYDWDKWVDCNYGY